MKRSPIRFGAPALLAAGLVLAACGDDDEPATSTESTESSEGTGAPASSTTAAAGGDEIAVTAVNYRYEGLPDQVAAGSTLSFRNDSTDEVHELVAMRLPDDETRSLDEILALPQAELVSLFAAEPAYVAVAPPTEDGFVAVGSETLDEPGRYAIVCFIPTGADPQAYLDALQANPGQPPSVPGGPPHFTAGMFQELTVE